VKGRCATCKWLDICAGNFRVRAEAVTGDVWAPDPACYLSDAAIKIERRYEVGKIGSPTYDVRCTKI
jgi:hypothetical protein